MSTNNYQAQADIIHRTFGIPVTVYTLDGSAPVHSNGSAGHRSLSRIAADIAADWTKPYFGAVPYLEAMVDLDQITDRYYEDDAEDVVRYFLANATTWRGETARTIKAELKELLK
jgi:hypothetical protein